MADQNRQVVQRLKTVQVSPGRWHGLLGDGLGTVEVPGRPGMYFVRVSKGSGYELGVFRGNVERNAENTPVTLQTDLLTGERLITGLDMVAIQYGVDQGNPQPITSGTHASSHEWNETADDQLHWLHTMQIFPLRVQPHVPYDGSVDIQPGAFYCAGAIHAKPTVTNHDLTTFYPVSGSKWVLLSIDATANIIITDNDAPTFSDLPPVPGNQFALAAVRLRAGVGTAISWTADIVDLRFITQETSEGSFIGLSDTPASYTGQANKILRVSADETGVVFGALLDYLDDVAASSPAVGYGLGWNGAQWEPKDYRTGPQIEAMILERGNGTLYLHEENSSIAGYEMLLFTPANGQEIIDTATASSATGEVLIDQYVTPVEGLGISLLPGGVWLFTTFAKVDNVAGVSKIRIKVFKRSQEGVETLLTTVDTPEINSTSVASYAIETVKPDYPINNDDMLVVKYYAVTDSASPRVISLYYEGAEHYSRIQTPFSGRTVAAVSVTNTQSINMTVSPGGQTISSDLRIVQGGGLGVNADGVYVLLSVWDLFELDNVGDYDYLGFIPELQAFGNMPNRPRPEYGNGEDGDVVISGSVTLSRDMNYKSLMITETGVLNTNGYKVCCKQTLYNYGVIRNSGGNGNNAGAFYSPGTGGAAAGAGSCYAPFAGVDGVAGSVAGDPGQPGDAGSQVPYSYSGTDGLAGANGGDCACTDGGAGGAGGTATLLHTFAGNVMNPVNVRLWTAFIQGVPVSFQLHGQNGGAGGGGSCSGESGAGGGAGGDGGAVVLFAWQMYPGIIESKGGNGGAGGNAVSSGTPGDSEGGGGGGAGGNGGIVVLMYDKNILEDFMDYIDVSGGAGGAGGSGVDGADDGQAGPTGLTGIIKVL